MEYYIISIIRAPSGESGESAENFINKYDFSDSCRICGAGAKLIGSLLVANMKNKDIFETYNDDLIISKKLYLYLLSHNCKIDILPVKHRRTKETLPFYHVNPKYEFPKISLDSRGYKTSYQCPQCKRDGYYSGAWFIEETKNVIIEPYQFVYKNIEEEFLNKSDLFKTWELYGVSNITKREGRILRIARPLIIVSEKIMNLFNDFGLKKIRYDKIIIEKTK